MHKSKMAKSILRYAVFLPLESLNRQFGSTKGLHRSFVEVPTAYSGIQIYPSTKTAPKIKIPLNVRTSDYPTYLEREVTIHTCANLYRQWAEERRYWTVPEDGVQLQVRYIDTGCETPEKSPVVLALHGAPGSCHNFSKLASHLHKYGARVIAPCFPDVTTYKMGKFRHTPEEKREYVNDFLQAIEIKQVDLLLCHSSSLFPGLLLCSEDNYPKVNAISLLNPTAFHYPKAMRPIAVVKACSRLFESPIGYHVATAIAKLVLSVKKDLKGGKHFDHVLSGFTLTSAEVPTRAVHFEKLVRRTFPIMLAFSENDKLIGKEASYSMAKTMVDDSEMHRYNAAGLLQKKGGTDPKKNVLIFEKGTHFLYNKHPEVVADAVTTFLYQNFRFNREQSSC